MLFQSLQTDFMRKRLRKVAIINAKISQFLNTFSATFNTKIFSNFSYYKYHISESFLPNLKNEPILEIGIVALHNEFHTISLDLFENHLRPLLVLDFFTDYDVIIQQNKVG